VAIGLWIIGIVLSWIWPAAAITAQAENDA
jgi:hypothetical protein